MYGKILNVLRVSVTKNYNFLKLRWDNTLFLCLFVVFVKFVLIS